MEEVIIHLPISRRTLFRLFESREELLFEIYKKAALFLNTEVRKDQALIDSSLSRTEGIEKRIESIIKVLITYEKHTQFIVEFDALDKVSDKVYEGYSEFYQKINYIYYLLEEQYRDDGYSKEELYRLSFLILETSFGLVYRLITTARSNYFPRIDENVVYEISYGLMAIIRKYEIKYKV